MLINSLSHLGRSNSSTSEPTRQRLSNLELYRIVVMLLIVAHHYVQLSGLMEPGSPLFDNPLSANSLYLYLFGMWGKTGINCFLLITGYFMCTSNISWRKYLKLYLWIITYRIALTLVFVGVGTETLSLKTLGLLLPFVNVRSDNFTSAFMAWWLFIPFLNVLVNHLSRKLHLYLIVLLLLFFSLYASAPAALQIHIESNPICWFSTLYVIASYIRKYPENLYRSSSVSFWCITSLVLILIASVSVVAQVWTGARLGRGIYPYSFVEDSFKPLALMIAVSTFLWFKNIRMGYSRIINILGGVSFGVLLLHSGTRAMVNWLWRDTVDCLGHYSLPLSQLMLYSIGSILAIYAVCSLIDYARLKFLEEPFFRWFDSFKARR